MFKNYVLMLPLTLSKMGTIQTSQSHVKKLAGPKFYLALGTLKLLLRLFSQPDWLPLVFRGWGAINPWKSPYPRRNSMADPDLQIMEGAGSAVIQTLK